MPVQFYHNQQMVNVSFNFHGLVIRRMLLVLQKRRGIRNNTHLNLMKKTLLLSSCIAMLGTLCTAQAAGTLVWDVSFTGTSSFPNTENIVAAGTDGNAYNSLSSSFGGGSVTDNVYNSGGSRLTITDSSSPLHVQQLQFCGEGQPERGGRHQLAVLFGLGEANSWNLKVNYTKGANTGWGFAPKGYSLSGLTSTAGTVVQGMEQTFIVTMDAGANDGSAQMGTSTLTLYLNGEAIATATLAASNRTNEKLDTFTLGGPPLQQRQQPDGGVFPGPAVSGRAERGTDCGPQQCSGTGLGFPQPGRRGPSGPAPQKAAALRMLFRRKPHGGYSLTGISVFHGLAAASSLPQP